MFEHDFQDQIVENYLFGLQGTQFKNIAANIEKSYSNKSEAPSRKEVQDSFDSDFWETFIEEFGFNPNNGIDFTNAIQEFGIKANKLVLKVSKSELESLNPNLDPSYVEKIISCMTLVDRDSWEQIPSPFKKSDWQPWRFKRRYSLAFKPLIYLESTQEFIVSPAQLQRGYLHLLRSCYEVQLDKSNFTSKK